ncbi:MAG: ATP-binding protein [Candidatus Gastranaerophilales bacterium]|nr:ATP-binding protein [Candidatus Gastranaerophilales bacterium]MCM1072545.1 ATP-binding protein [Bacteroides sp.]
MAKFFSKRRLKIAEQIIIVIFFAVIIPMTISGIIINNVNQQSNRAQLRDAAVMIANVVSEEVDVFENSINNELAQISTTLEYYNSPEKTDEYLKSIIENLAFYKELRVVSDTEFKQNYENKTDDDIAIFSKELNNGQHLVAVLDMKNIKVDLFKTLNQDKRQIYVISSEDGRLISSVNYEKEVFESSIAQLPSTLKQDETVIFGDIKNQPLAYHKKTNPDITIIVNTTEDVTKSAIDYNRDKILLSIILTVLTVFFVVGLYTSYLYINIRQLFKAIIAISKGNYERRIRLLTNIFTPFEIVFLGNEFNRMVSQIHKSYIQLKKKNRELKQLNEFRSNMVDTVSHELRTPLTSIQGYTSRLLRQDIEIDEETKQKSLKVIKRQAERLKRMIEDLLVIPDIEGARLNFNLKPVAISSVIENSVTLVKNDAKKEIINNIKNCEALVLADNDRIEQVFVNLIENAVKYSKDDSDITLDYELRENKLVVSVKNDYDIIPREKLKTLFDKFTRIDDSTTRTTRGTGLGLYIVKGLVEAMDGEIRLYSNEECGFCVKVYLPLVIEEKIYV